MRRALGHTQRHSQSLRLAQGPQLGQGPPRDLPLQRRGKPNLQAMVKPPLDQVLRYRPMCAAAVVGPRLFIGALVSNSY